MAQVDEMYHQLLDGILTTGYRYRTKNRPDVDCIQLSSVNMRLPLTEFPLLTTKAMNIEKITAELLWFLMGSGDIRDLWAMNCHIWDKDWYYGYQKKTSTPYTMKEMKEKSGVFGETLDMELHDGVWQVGRNYGVQWRRWSTFDWINGEAHHAPETDQIQGLLSSLRDDEHKINRRRVITAWNPAELHLTVLPACHWAWEIIPEPLSPSKRILYSGGDQEYLNALWDAAYMKNDQEAKATLEKELAGVPEWGFTLKWMQRSVDTFLGLPFNIASYAMLAVIIGRITGMQPVQLEAVLSNVHIYEPHTEVVKEQLKRDPRRYKGPGITFSDQAEMNFSTIADPNELSSEVLDKLFQSLNTEMFKLNGYGSYEKLTANMFEQTV